jgi:hypothetical protein
MKKFITKIEFAKMLAIEILNSAFAQVVSETEPKLNKKNRVTGQPLPFAKVTNNRDLNIQLGYDYDAQVIAKAEKEGIDASDFQSQEHSWARRVAGNLARHMAYDVPKNADGSIDWANVDSSKLYMPYKVMSIREQSYFADGQRIAKEILTDFFPPKDNYSSQPAEAKVPVQYMKMSSVKEFKFGGVEYVIK